MRADWIHRPLGDVCKVVGGGTPSKREPDLYKGGIPWATVRDMRHEILYETQFSITHEAVKSSTTNVIPGGNVVIATRVGLGKVCLLQQDTAINQDLRGIIPKSDNLDARYLFRWFQSIADDIEAEGTGATVKGVKLTFVKGLNLPIPPISEQKSIVAILDEAFAGIDTAIANTEKNLANARELFESNLNSTFIRGEKNWIKHSLSEVSNISSKLVDPKKPEHQDMLHVGAGNIVSIKGDLIGLKTASEEGLISGKFIFDNTMVLYSKIRPYLMKVVRPNFSGLCSADIYPLSPNPELVCRDFLYYLLLSNDFTDYVIAGSARAGMPKVNREHLFAYSVALPKVDEQKAIVEKLDAVFVEGQRLETIYQQKLDSLNELKQSLLQKAFSGELAANNVIEIPTQKQTKALVKTNSPEFAAHIMAAAYHWHASQSREKTFGRVKAQKTLHLVESLADIDLGRQPIKDAAGPNDFQHMQRAENWARDRGFFEFVKRPTGQRGYDFKKGERYGDLVAEAMQALAPYEQVLKRVVQVLMPLNTAETEILATVYAAWNNLLLEGIEPTENAIIHEARENWHADKLKYSEEQFRSAISQLRHNGLVPQGRGKRVTGQESLAL